MKILDAQTINNIKFRNFESQNISDLYKKMTHIILNNTCNLLFNKNVDYDYNNLNDRIKELTMECRNGEFPEYDEDKKTIYVSMYNQLQERLPGEEQIITTIHETLHFMTFGKDDSLNEEYFGFDEFFTEYLTYLIAMRVGGKKLESYYNKQPGYCSKEDTQFMRNLTIKADFAKLLTAYFSRSARKLEEIVPKEVLLDIQDYFVYYTNIFYKYNLPKKVINQKLEEDINFMTYKNELAKKLHKIKLDIENLESSRKYH